MVYTTTAMTLKHIGRPMLFRAIALKIDNVCRQIASRRAGCTYPKEQYRADIKQDVMLIQNTYLFLQKF